MPESATILIVEDDLSFAEMTCEVLTRAGYRLLPTAANAAQALQRVEATLPDLVLMDIALPGGMDGIAAAELLMARFGLPVIYLTGHDDASAMERAKISVPMGYLRKPFRPHDLEMAVEIALYRHAMERKLREQEQQYRTLFEQVPIGLYQAASDGRILACNPAFRALLGIADDPVPVNLLDFYVSLDARAAWQSPWRDAELPRVAEVQIRRADGALIWVESSVRALHDAQGQWLYFEGTLSDITERKQGAESLARRNHELALLNAAAERLGSTLDLEQVLSSILDEVRQMLGVTASSVWLLDPSTQELVCRQASGPQKDVVRGWRLTPKAGVAGWVARNGKSLVVPDVSQESRYFHGVDEKTGLDTRSILGVPLRGKEAVIGVIQVLDTRVGRFTSDDLALIESLAAVAANAIENARLHEEVDRLFRLTQSALAQAEALYQISQYVSERRGLEEVLQTITDTMARVLPADGVLLILFNAGEQTIERVVRGGPGRARLDIQIPETWPEGSLFAVALEQGDPVFSSARQSDPRESAEMRRLRASLGVGSLIVIPLRHHEVAYGALIALNRADQEDFDARHVELAQAMAEQVSVAIQTARLDDALCASETRYRAISELITDYAYAFQVVSEEEWHWEWITDSFSRGMGLSLEDLEVFDLWQAVVFPEDRDSVVAQLQRLYTEPVVTFELCLRGPDAQPRWLLNHLRPERDAEGHVLRVIGASQDITERKQAEMALARQLEQLASLNRTSQAITASLEFETVLSEIVNLVTEVTGADYAGIALVGESGDIERIVQFAVDDVQPTTLLRPEGFVHWVTRSRQMVVVDEVLEDGRIVAPAFQGLPATANPLSVQTGVRSFAVLPLAVKERLLGVLVVLSKRPTIFSEQTALLSTFANQAASALENVQLYEAVKRQGAQLQALTVRLAEAEEAERQWLARELHDQVGQNLTALGINLKLVQSLLPDGDLTQAITRLDDALVSVEQLAERIRNVMADLRPPVLDDYGLLAALRWYGAQFANRTGIAVQVQGEALAPRLAVSAETAFFRIAQEALTNVAKHARATRVQVILTDEGGRVGLFIKDDGVGLAATRSGEAGQHRGWGLISMTERASAIGGLCRIEPAPGGGTQVSVEVRR